MTFSKENPSGFLSGSTLKILACIFMLIDHAGIILFPTAKILRVIGRLSFPLFAYFIAEGCKYTRHKLRRFLLIFGIGIALMIFYFLWDGTVYGNTFMTFAVSIAMIYLLDFCKRLVLVDYKHTKLVLAILIYAFAIALTYILMLKIDFDYGFYGAMVPVCVSLFNFRGLEVPKALSALDNYALRALMLAFSLLPLCFENVHGDMNIFGLAIPVQWMCLGAVILVLFYNGKPGVRQLKYAFYIFYPLHLVILEAIAMLLSRR